MGINMNAIDRLGSVVTIQILKASIENESQSNQFCVASVLLHLHCQF
jgi:hypothetical protein